MRERIEQLRAQLRNEVAQVADPTALARVRDRYLGRKSGLITQLIKALGALPPEERPEIGRLINELKDEAEAMLERLHRRLQEQAEAERFERERVDVTVPGLRPVFGARHPITLIRERIEDIFVSMGYSVESGPEVETSYYNFDALNIPPGHPAREAQDTFYISDDLALRTQTSTVQIRALERRRPPLRIIAPGKVFRRDTPDPRRTHRLEVGLLHKHSHRDSQLFGCYVFPARLQAQAYL
jgi:phenylalanyl-tRNA synthetase alpha chain